MFLRVKLTAYNVSSSGITPMDIGKAPVSEFAPKSIYVSWVKLLKTSGKDPLSKLERKFLEVRVSKSIISEMRVTTSRYTISILMRLTLMRHCLQYIQCRPIRCLCIPLWSSPILASSSTMDHWLIDILSIKRKILWLPAQSGCEDTVIPKEHGYPKPRYWASRSQSVTMMWKI